MKKLLFLVGCFWLMMLLGVPQGYSQPQVWKIGHVRPEGSAIDTAVRKFAEGVSQDTGGAVEFSFYPANKLGDYSTVQERVAFGEVEMYVGPFGTTVDRKLMLAFVPFLVDNWSAAQRLYSESSPLIGHLQNFLEPLNIRIIAGWPVYFGGIALTEAPVAPGNPDISKDMIIRVPPIRSFEMTARALGYTPYPITWMYATMGLKTGMVKGLIGGGAEGYKGLSKLIRYYIPVKDHFEYWFVYMNLDLWKSLSSEHRQAVTARARQMETERYAVAEREESRNIEALQGLGVQMYELSEAEYASMRQKVRQTVWPQLRKDIGQPFDEVVRFAGQQD